MMMVFFAHLSIIQIIIRVKIVCKSSSSASSGSGGTAANNRVLATNRFVVLGDIFVGTITIIIITFRFFGLKLKLLLLSLKLQSTKHEFVVFSLPLVH